MTIRFFICRSLLLPTAALALPVAAFAGQPKVSLCHFPPGNPANVQYITVGQSAADTHVTKHQDIVCAEGSTTCCYATSGSACTNLQSDNGNCGSCGNACAAGATCADGVCGSPCETGLTKCGEACVDTSSDSTNCGQCGTVCNPGQACAAGVCTSNPNPECQGQTCETFTICQSGSSCNENGVCGSTAEGGGLCIDGSTPCAGLQECTASTDCTEPGAICFVNSCCGVGVCVPTAQFCR